jgi:hypothetical protein
MKTVDWRFTASYQTGHCGMGKCQERPEGQDHEKSTKGRHLGIERLVEWAKVQTTMTENSKWNQAWRFGDKLESKMLTFRNL